MNAADDILGYDWAARLRRAHERHAGIPDYGYCPGRADRPRADVAPITSRMLAEQRELFRRYPRAARIPVRTSEPLRYDPAGDPPEDQWHPYADGDGEVWR